MENKNVFFSSNLKWIRKESKISQTELANWLNKKTSVISAYELGKTMPPLGVLTNIADIAGVKVDELLNEDLSKKQVNKKIINDNLNDDQNDNRKSKNTFKMQSHDEGVRLGININLTRIEEVKNVIKILAENYKFSTNEEILFACYDSEYNRLDAKKTINEYRTLKNIPTELLYNYGGFIDKLLLAIYDDLYRINYIYNVVMSK